MPVNGIGPNHPSAHIIRLFLGGVISDSYTAEPKSLYPTPYTNKDMLRSLDQPEKQR